jgi:hypothetical protein
MSREVRRVPMDWQHPMEWRPRWDRITGGSPMTLVPRPLLEDYPDALADWQRNPDDWDGHEPDRADYMPEFAEGTATGWCMYETTSEGTPISPVFETPEELGSMTATYEQWLRIIQGPAWAPSAVMVGSVLMSGVESTPKEV